MMICMITTLALSQYADTGSINPELAEGAPWLDTAVSVSNGLMNSGIDPGLALATVAAVPVVLKVLNMVNQFTVAAIDDWREGNKIRRERERLELEAEAVRVHRLGGGLPSSVHPSGRPVP
jgi:hypothetical protein